MKLEKWALIAQIVGSVAVVATLLVLTVEIRSGANAVRAGSQQEALRLLMEHNATIAANPELARLIWTGIFEQNASSLTGAERFQLSQISSNIFFVYETAYLSHEYGMMNDAEWARWPPAICNVYDQFRAADLWRGTGFTPNFIRYVEACPHDSQ